MAAPLAMPSGVRGPGSTIHVPTSEIRKHIRNQTEQLFTHCFRVMTHTQNLNQHIWEERQELQKSIRRTPPRTWLARLWSRTDDEVLLRLMDAQLEANTNTILWCHQKLQDNLQLSPQSRDKLQALLHKYRNTKFSAFVKKNLNAVWKVGGMGGILMMIDFYYQKSRGFNALMQLIGRRDLKLQRLLPQWVWETLTDKMGLQPDSIQDKFWAWLLKVAKNKIAARSTLFSRFRMSGGAPGSPPPGCADQEGDDPPMPPLVLADWAHA
jgi:hypothetical protein